MSTVPVETSVRSLTAHRRKKLSEKDIGPTGPGTLTGRYLRRFWHPVFHAEALPPGARAAARASARRSGSSA